MITLFTKEDTRPLNEDETYVNQYVVINEEFFAPEYKSAEYQLFLAKGGFGCDPSKIGSAIFGADISECYRQERYYILGVAKEETIQKWEELYGHSRDELQKVYENSTVCVQ